MIYFIPDWVSVALIVRVTEPLVHVHARGDCATDPVGAVVSFLIGYTLLATGPHPLSLILIKTGVIPVDGVNVNDNPFALSVQLDQLLIE